MATNILFEATILDGSTPVTVRMSRAGGTADGVYLDNKEWAPVITRRHSLAGSWNSDGLFSEGSVNNSSLSFIISDTYDNTSWTGYEWNGGLGRVFIGQEGEAFSTYVQVFEGSLSSLNHQGIQGTVALLGSDALLNRQLLDLEYAGTGDAEGPQDMKGKLKPRAFGVCQSVEPVLINAGLQIYQVHGYGPIPEITTVYDFAIGLDEAKRKPDQATYADLAALTLVPGEFATCLAQGLFRLGAASKRKISADIKGGTATQVPGILGQLLTIAGIPSAKQGDFSAFNGVTWNLYQTDQITIGEAARAAVYQAGGILFADGQGKWQVGDFFNPKAAVVLNGDRSTLPLVRDYRLLETANPVFKVQYGYDRCWGVHNSTDVSPALAQDIDGEALQEAIDKADQAAADAEAAIARLDAMSADDKLDRAEKARLVLIFSTESALQNGLQNQATRANVTTERNTLSTKFNAWKTYLEGLSPAYTDTTTDTPIDRVVFNTRSREYFVAKQALVDAMAGRASQTADWQSVTGTGKPQDNATVGAPAGTSVNGIPVETLTSDLTSAKNKATATETLVNSIVDNGILDRSEKQTYMTEWAQIDGEQSFLSLFASDRGLDFSGVNNAYIALRDYLGGLSPQWNNVNVDTPINRDTFRARNLAYSNARYDLIQKGNRAAKQAEDSLLGEVTAISSDGVLDKSEKVETIQKWRAINDRLTAAVNRYNDLGSPGNATTPKNDAGARIQDLASYLGGISPGWNNTTANSPINRTDWDNKWIAAINAVVAFENALIGNLTAEYRQSINLLAEANRDNVWSVPEKIHVIIPNDRALQAVYEALIAQSNVTGWANDPDVINARSGLNTGRDNWINYRDSVRPFWNDLTQSSNINRDTANSRLAEYERALENMSIALSKYVNTKAQFAVDRIQSISSDGVLDRSEKWETVVEWQSLNSEYNSFNVKNQSLGYPSNVSSAANRAYNAIDPNRSGSLGQYLGTLSPAWNDATTDTPINRTTWQNKWIEAKSAMGEYRAAITGQKGDKGDPGTSTTTDPTSAQTSYSGQGLYHGWRGPAASLSLNAGQTATIEMALYINSNQSVNINAYLQCFNSSDQHVANITNTSQNFVPNEPDQLYVAGNFTNNSGTKQTYNFHGHTLISPQINVSAGNGSYISVRK